MSLCCLSRGVATLARAGSINSHLRPATRMARAGPSRTQRSQRAPKPSQSQTQRPPRSGRRVADEDDEDENTGERDDPDMDINASQGRDDADAVSSLFL